VPIDFAEAIPIACQGDQAGCLASVEEILEPHEFMALVRIGGDQLGVAFE
jgi:hypothetical protein